MGFFDKHFEREFKQTLAGVKRSTSTQFNLSTLGIHANERASEIVQLVTLKGILEQSVFAPLNGVQMWISSRSELNSTGAYSFANKAKNLHVSKDEVLVATSQLIKVPNNYNNPDKRITYLGVEMSETFGSAIMYLRVSKELVYPQTTFVTTISTKTVPKHYGGRIVTLTNGHTVQIVIQNKLNTRNTDAKSVFYISSSLEDAKGSIQAINEALVQNGRAFHSSYFAMKDDFGLDYNLVVRDIEATDDIPETLVEYSLAQKEEMRL